MSSYRYNPLPSEGNYIRLLCLQPSESEAEPLKCKLYSYSLQRLSPRPHRYEALSYVWGDSSSPLPIYVDGDWHPITVNLHAALSHLRDRYFERIIWIDAICIDLTNSEEHSQQVRLMAKIYSEATSVIVWLGEATDGSDQVIEEIRATAGNKYTLSSYNEMIQGQILALLQRPWFRRIWVREQSLGNCHKSY